MPQEEQAMLGAAEAPVDNMVELMRGMAPKEAAQQLELFGSERNIYEYADSLKPQDLREFVGNVKKKIMKFLAILIIFRSVRPTSSKSTWRNDRPFNSC